MGNLELLRKIDIRLRVNQVEEQNPGDFMVQYLFNQPFIP